MKWSPNLVETWCLLPMWFSTTVLPKSLSGKTLKMTISLPFAVPERIPQKCILLVTPACLKFLRRTSEEQGTPHFINLFRFFKVIICIKNKTALKTRLFWTTKQIGFWICYVLRICFHLVCLNLNVFKYKWFFFRYFIEFI